MSFVLNSSLILGTSQVGLALQAQLIDVNGDNVGSPITTGFVETGNGTYLWSHSFPDGFTGAVIISSNGEVMTLIDINQPIDVSNDIAGI